MGLVKGEPEPHSWLGAPSAAHQLTCGGSVLTAHGLRGTSEQPRGSSLFRLGCSGSCRVLTGPPATRPTVSHPVLCQLRGPWGPRRGDTHVSNEGRNISLGILMGAVSHFPSFEVQPSQPQEAPTGKEGWGTTGQRRKYGLRSARRPPELQCPDRAGWLRAANPAICEQDPSDLTPAAKCGEAWLMPCGRPQLI